MDNSDNYLILGDHDGYRTNTAWTLQRPAAQYANKVATIDRGTGERRIWSEVADRVSGLSSGLLGLDLEIADCAEHLCSTVVVLELQFAIPGAGMVMNDLNYRLAEEELAFMGDSDVKVLFVDDNYLDVGRALLHVSTTHIGSTGPASAPAARIRALVASPLVDLPQQQHDGLAAIFYTGGTTGLPKGAMLTHRNLTANAMHGVGVMGLTHRDTYLHAGPQFHLADGSMTYAVSWVGGAHVFIPAFEPAATVSALANEHCTTTLLVPPCSAWCSRVEPSTVLTSRHYGR